MTRTQPVAEKHNEESTRQYELGTYRLSVLFAEELIERSGIAQSSQKPLVIFDNACGTGAVSSTLHKSLKDDTTRNWQLTCGDISEAMVEATKQKMNMEGWWNVEVKVVDAQDTRLPSAHYTHIFSSFGMYTGPTHKEVC
jgi:ubiquinone/menaquinone biosynthesis C-methylase UbiE